MRETPDETCSPAAPDEEVPLGAGLNLADPHSPLAPLYLRLPHVLAALGLAVVFVLFTYLPVWHTDIWAHLRFGESIVNSGHLPSRETFSGDFADQQAEYVNFQWAAQAGGYYLFDLGRRLAAPDDDARLGGGALMLSTAHAAVVALRLLLLLLAFRRLTASLPWALAGVALVFVMGCFVHLRILRPQILGELAFAAVLLALSRRVLSRRALELVPLAFVLWANCHGSFPVGLALLGIALVGRALGAVVAAGGLAGLRTDDQVRRLAAVLVLSVAAIALLNPHGPALFRHSLQLAGNPNVASMEEWKPLPVKSAAGWVFLASVLVLVPVLRFSPIRFTPTQVLLLVAFGLQSLAHARMLVWWTMVFPWVLLPHLQAIAARHLPRLQRPGEPPNFRWTLTALLGVPLLMTWSAPLQWLLFREAPSGARRVTPETPVRAARLIQNAYDADRDGHLGRCVFASETTGDYLLWALRPRRPVRVFCYTHVHLLTPTHWRECLAVKFGEPGWQDILDRHGVDFLVVESALYGAPTGFSDLVDQVRADPRRWEVLAGGPVFVARRIRPAPGR